MRVKLIGVITRWLFILCLPILLFTGSLAWAVNSLWLYRSGFEKYNISQTTGLAPSELDKAARGLISYFNSNEATIDLTVVKDGRTFPLFNAREVVHLKDVKDLFWLDYRLLLATLLYILVYTVTNLFLKRRRRLARDAVFGSGLTLALMLVIGLGIWLNFDRLFLAFHLISFANDFWQLDPAKDYLIMLFPGGFWYDAARNVALATAVMAVVLAGVSGGYLLATRATPRTS